MSGAAKLAALALLDTEYEAMETLFSSLTSDEVEHPVFTGEGSGWRVRDLIAHFAYVLAFLGEAPGVDARNDENFRAWRERPVSEAMAHLRACHRRLIDAIRALPPERVVKSEAPEDWYRYFWQPGLNHLRQHSVHIEAALRESPTP